MAEATKRPNNLPSNTHRVQRVNRHECVVGVCSMFGKVDHSVPISKDQGEDQDVCVCAEEGGTVVEDRAGGGWGFGIAERVGAVGENGSEWENGCSLPSVRLSGAARRVSSQCVVSLRVVVMRLCSTLLLFYFSAFVSACGPFSGNLLQLLLALCRLCRVVVTLFHPLPRHVTNVVGHPFD